MPFLPPSQQHQSTEGILGQNPENRKMIVVQMVPCLRYSAVSSEVIIE